MINPCLTPKNHPRLKVEVKLDKWQEIDCLIDTGFSGGISLPETFQTKLTRRPLGFQEYELADGSRTIFAIYEVRVKYAGRIKITSLVFTKSEDSLLGIEFLTGLRLVLDLKNFSISLE